MKILLSFCIENKSMYTKVSKLPPAVKFVQQYDQSNPRQLMGYCCCCYCDKLDKKQNDYAFSCLRSKDY